MANFNMAFPQGKRKALTLSYDDGVEQDIRLMEIMNQYGLKGTFNINSALFSPEGTVWPKGHIHRRMTKAQATALYKNSGHEVAIHATEHGDLSSLPAAAAVWQVMQDKAQLEEQFGCIIRGMAYPYGTCSNALADTLAGCGIAYSRTVQSTGAFSIPTQWLLMPATCHHNDPNLMKLAHKFLEEEPRLQPWLFYLWGHSYEFEAKDNWQVIEEFAAFVGNQPTVWYATNLQVYDYVQAWNSLQSSADGRRLFNPSCQSLWIWYRGAAVEIPSGKEIYLAE